MNKLLNNRFIALLKLARIENLVMTALTLYMLRYFVLQKILIGHSLSLVLNDRFFGVLVLSTVFIAAAGYIINDYFDVKTDLINHPDTVVVDKVIKRRSAIILHLTFTFTGIALGILCSLKAGYLRLALFHFLSAILLWFYSTHFKKQLLIGNIVVSLLSASVIFIPLVYEIGLMQRTNPDFSPVHSRAILICVKVTLIFSVFAFLSSMAREIIKDMEDFKGDKETGGHTLPIYWGMAAAKLTAFFLLLIVVLLLLFVAYNTFKVIHDPANIQILYILFALVLPLLLLMFSLMKAKESLQYKRASLFLKLIMLSGLCYSIIYYYF
jgi:4-hydroxybenzoate polyprenyltransferase